MATGVYLFDEVPKGEMTKAVLGGKGFGIAEMTALGLPVPAGIVITTGVCNEFFKKEKKIWPELKESILRKVDELEKRTGKKFGNPSHPLLVSVRSGAPLSMPGMMDTVLNLGINDVVVQSLAATSGDERFAYDTYRRFVQLFGKIVMGVPGAKFDAVLEKIKDEARANSDLEMKAKDWKKVVARYKELIKSETKKEIPQDPREQLLMAIAAVFNSWWGQRAVEYRKIYKIPDTLGTAVNIMMMVYGNLDDKSGSGVAFTRDPNTGERKLYGEYLTRAQGEDVVAGIRTPLPVSKLREDMPKVYAQLEDTAKKLEAHFRDMQDVEFTIESGKFYMLQTRNGKRTALAAVDIAIDMVAEKLIKKEEAVLRVEPDQLVRLLYKQIDPKAKAEPIAKGLPASPGAATGKIVFGNEAAVAAKQKGTKIILVRLETAPEDIAGIAACDGVLTSRGGMTSHAAVVTRGMGKPCIVGAESIRVDLAKKAFAAGGREFKEGDTITIDGGTGRIFAGEMPLVDPALSTQVSTILDWADSFRRLEIWANADTPQMATKARQNGAQGIGLCRTERMFGAPERLVIVQKMIISDSAEERKMYLDQIKPMQKGDFKEIFRVMSGLPVTIRLIDLPLHEFLPKLDEILPLVTELRITGKKPQELKEKERVLERVMELRESNPMMGQRGVRLGLMYTEIYRMQVGAIFEAAAELAKEKVKLPGLDIMISQVAEAEEVHQARKIVDEEAEATMRKYKVKFDYEVGSMIETPRAALTATSMAKYSDFFSFGTNDLTQATFAFSRDDVEAKFIPFYIESKVLPSNPFETLDPQGVGRLVALCATEGKKSNPKLQVGVCGEHGGDPKSIEFFNTTEVDYVSCSPFRVPVARLAAAQAELSAKTGNKDAGTV